MSEASIVAIVVALITSGVLAGVWKGGKRLIAAIEETGYERARTEAVITESTETVAAKDVELVKVYTELAEVKRRADWYRMQEIPRLQLIEDEQRRIIADQARALGDRAPEGAT